MLEGVTLRPHQIPVAPRSNVMMTVDACDFTLVSERALGAPAQRTRFEGVTSRDDRKRASILADAKAGRFPEVLKRANRGLRTTFNNKATPQRKGASKYDLRDVIRKRVPDAFVSEYRTRHGDIHTADDAYALLYAHDWCTSCGRPLADWKGMLTERQVEPPTLSEHSLFDATGKAA